MTALRGLDHDGLLQGLAENDLDAFEASRVPVEHFEESPEDITIDAAQSGMRLLANLIQETRNGKTPSSTLQEIGAALVGGPLFHVICERDTEIRKLKAALDNVHPNWFEKVCLAKRQENLLKAASRSFFCAISTLDNDLYATRVSACRSILSDAFDELKGEGYEFESDES